MAHLHFTADLASPGAASQVALSMDLSVPVGIRFLLSFQGIDVYVIIYGFALASGLFSVLCLLSTQPQPQWLCSWTDPTYHVSLLLFLSL